MALTYCGSTAFRRELEKRVASYFEAGNRSRHGTGRMLAKTVILLGWLAASYVAMVWGAATWWQAVPLAISIALAMAGIGFNIQHDGNHGAYSRHPALNKAAALSLNLLGGDAYFWHYKHNIAHHSYPNISGADNDIYMGPFARMSPHDKRYWFHRFQYIYIWGLYSLLAVKWQLTGNGDDLAHDVDVLPGSGEWPRVGLAVPTLDDLRPRRAQPEDEPTVRQVVERDRRHRRGGGVRADICMIAVPSLSVVVLAPHHASGVSASEPYASAVQIELNPSRSASTIASATPAGGPADQYPVL